MLHEITRNPKVQAAFVGKTLGASEADVDKLKKSSETRKASAYTVVDVLMQTKGDYLSESSIDYFVDCLKADEFDKCNTFTMLAMLNKMSQANLGETSKVSKEWYEALGGMDMFETYSILPVYKKRSLKKGVKKTDGFEVTIFRRDGGVKREIFYKRDNVYKVSKIKKMI